jgi:elongation factor P
MLSHTDLKKGTTFILEGQPYKVLESSLVFKGRGRSVVQTKIKNLITGNVISRTFHQGEEFEEAEIEKVKLKFIYSHRNQYVFSEIDNPKNRISLTQQQIGSSAQFLKPNQQVEGLIFNGKTINVELPIKVYLKVVESPPGIRAGRAEAGTKQVTLETGAKINAPLFIKEGDIIEVNTQTGEYVRRINSD